MSRPLSLRASRAWVSWSGGGVGPVSSRARTWVVVCQTTAARLPPYPTCASLRQLPLMSTQLQPPTQFLPHPHRLVFTSCCCALEYTMLGQEAEELWGKMELGSGHLFGVHTRMCGEAAARRAWLSAR